MGKAFDFEINLNQPQAVYIAGSTIEGHVSVELNEDMKLRGESLAF